MEKLLLFFLFAPSIALSQRSAVTGVVHTHDVDLAYEVYGAPSSATPAIVINGGPGFVHNYLLISDVFSVRLAQHRQVVVYDQRGVGKSELLNPSAPVDLNAQIAGLEALRTKLGFRTFDIIGHSWGGTISMAYAAAHPDHIHKFVVIGSAAPKLIDTLYMFKSFFPDQLAQDKQRADANKNRPRTQADVGQDLRRYIRRDFFSQEMFDRYISPLSDNALGALLDEKMDNAVETAAENVDLNSALPTFHFPALIINGRYDMNVAPLVAWNIYRAIPNAKLAIFEKSGHFPFLEEEDQFLGVVNDFLADD